MLSVEDPEVRHLLLSRPSGAKQALTDRLHELPMAECIDECISGVALRSAAKFALSAPTRFRSFRRLGRRNDPDLHSPNGRQCEEGALGAKCHSTGWVLGK